jgi:hypothetical protein
MIVFPCDPNSVQNLYAYGVITPGASPPLAHSTEKEIREEIERLQKESERFEKKNHA